MTNLKVSGESAPGGTAASPLRCIAFEGPRCIASGELGAVAKLTKAALRNADHGPILIFDAVSSRPIEIDFRGSLQQVLERLARMLPTDTSSSPAPEHRGPGRPKLGVIGREVTLLPRHWEWLDGQPGGASVALRKLVEEARRANRGKDLARQSQESVYRFMLAMAGDLPGYEEALRAFYRGNKAGVEERIRSWPSDIRKHLRSLLATAYHDAAKAGEQ